MAVQQRATSWYPDCGQFLAPLGCPWQSPPQGTAHKMVAPYQGFPVAFALGKIGAGVRVKTWHFFLLHLKYGLELPCKVQTVHLTLPGKIYKDKNNDRTKYRIRQV